MSGKSEGISTFFVIQVKDAEFPDGGVGPGIIGIDGAGVIGVKGYTRGGLGPGGLGPGGLGPGAGGAGAGGLILHSSQLPAISFGSKDSQLSLDPSLQNTESEYSFPLILNCLDK